MTQTFGRFLKQLRKRSGMTQQDLAAATGYSRSLIGALERNARLPDIAVVTQSFLPALGLQDEPRLAIQLVTLAAQARGERPPSLQPFTREHQPVGTTKEEDTIHFPYPPTALIGRDQAVNHLCNRLLGYQGRLLTLVGPPGVGKTRLALAVGTNLQSIYKNSACFISLAAISDPALLASSLALALKIPDRSGKRPEIRLIEHLRHKEMLLILDNFEQIIDSAPLVGELLAECAGLRILATSRERLHLRAEQRFKVPPLDLEPAVDLFVQRAQAVEPNFALTMDNETVICELCRRLDYLPLALELCAAQIDLFSPPQLLAQLQAHSLDLLAEGAHDLPPRQRTLRIAIDYSYQLLDEMERRVFRSLGVFVGGFDLSAVEAVCAREQKTDAPPLFSTLHALIGKSLVCSETLPNGEQRFLLLETIREFALEQARVQSEGALLRHRHYTTYLHLFRTAHSHLRDPNSTIWLARLEPEQDNLRTALQWAFEKSRWSDAAWLILAAEWFWQMHGYGYEKGKWLAQLLPYRQALEVDLRLAILVTIFSAADAWEEFQPVGRYTDEVRQLLVRCSNKHLKATAWFWLAVCSCDFIQAEAAWEQSIASARTKTGDPELGAEFCILANPDFILVSSLWGYAGALIERGEVKRATPLMTESLDIFRARGNPYELADSFGRLGLLALLQGDLVLANQHLDEAVTIATNFNLQGMLGNWQSMLGLVTLCGGDAVEARRLLDESLRLCIELKEKVPLARVCTYLAETALWENDLSQAEQWLAQSFAHYADPCQITIHEVMRLWVAARLATAQQQYQQAATLFGLAEQAHSQIHHVIGGPMHSLADAALATVQAALAPAAFGEAFAAGQVLSLEETFTVMLPQSPTTLSAQS